MPVFVLAEVTAGVLASLGDELEGLGFVLVEVTLGVSPWLGDEFEELVAAVVSVVSEDDV